MKFTKYILYIWGLMLCISCEKDDLDLVPLDKISDASYWKSASDFEKAANNFYFFFPRPTTSYDLDSDHFMGKGQNATSSGNITAPETSGTWNNNYALLRRVNRLIENASEEQEFYEDIKTYIGEAKFFRAWAYFNLAKTYGDVPLVKKVLSLDSPELTMARTDKKEVVSYIMTNLDEALDLVPLESKVKAKGRITKGAVLALQSRAALFFGTWRKYHEEGGADELLDKAIQAGEAIISSGEYEIYTDGGFDIAYQDLFIEVGDRSKESILNSRQDYERGRTHNVTRELFEFDACPTKQLVDLYLMNNGLPIEHVASGFVGRDSIHQEDRNRDPRMHQTVMLNGDSAIRTVNSDGSFKYVTLRPNIALGGGTSTGYMVYKYFSKEANALEETRADFDRIMFRLGEVLLNTAEAYFERNGNITNAQLEATINELRRRVGMPILTNEFVTANGLDMKTEIRRERAVELAYEGFRRDDLKRWKEGDVLAGNLLGVKYTDTEYEDKVSNSQPLTADGYVIADPADKRIWKDEFYYAPIPISELQLNPNLNPNPGY
jgi:hypothetical protein